MEFVSNNYRKRGSEFTDFGLWDDNNAKRAKVDEVINIDESDDDEDDYSLGFIHRSSFKFGKTERRKAENEAYLAEPEVRNRDTDHWLGFVNETIANAKEALDKACRFAYGDNWSSRRSEGRYVGRDVNDLVDCEVVQDWNCEPEAVNSKGVGVSLTDSFTADQIREHLRSLKEPNETVVGKYTCQLCAKDDLMFAPPPCSCCMARIKPGSICYKTVDEFGAQYSFCNTCVSKSHCDHILVKERSFPKEVLVKGNNVAERDETWVQCHQCQRRQHQICALYNSVHAVEGNMTYTCPLCRLNERQGIPNVSVTPTLGAQDLPRTLLSDHLEQRLLSRLANERKQRAKSQGRVVEEVPAEDLVVRVVLAADKQIEVKQKFLDILYGENYPSEFPYNSKVIMLFQKVEGADVCLFAIYVQEFGSECGKPNQRSVYISYIDSINYFRPQIETDTHLRTFVYHEILIGYLDYCKKHGFDTCYIWACPPVKGDDYIFYCHPEDQKMPNPKKLRKWYKMMLEKAMEDNVVAEYTNVYDYFFVPKDNQNKKITAARLPYFDGDFWTGAIENMIETIEKGCNGDSKKNKPKKSMTKRTSKSTRQDDLSDKNAEDIQVMKTLGKVILPSKDDFFVVHLQFPCTNCHEPIPSGNRWSCKQCKNFHLCESCIEGEQSRYGLRTHTTNRGEKHSLIQTPKDVADTNDTDIGIDNGIFENRDTFLNFCQNNNYQFDTLRRAKHSSMMIIYYLHKTARLST